MDEDHNIAITTDPKVINIEGMQEATLKDIRRAVLEISADLAAQAASQYFLSTISGPQQPDDEPTEG
jgi:hypothetical protein